jgi:putative flavoprotein involved in K+ transport
MRGVDTDVIVVGAGQAGLALSHFLAADRRDHVVLERGNIGESWRSQRWDSFCMVTPNWTIRLPGMPYDGNDPDGFMPSAEFIARLERFAETFSAPLATGQDVKTIRRENGAFTVQTSDRAWRARNVVVASGHYAAPRRPGAATALPSDICQIDAIDYRNPDQLPPGAVLVVGSGQTGCQIVEDLIRAGRRVFLCVGRSGRLPRRYRGRDCLYWQHQMGWLDRTPDMLDSPGDRFRGDPHLSGRDGGYTISLHRFAHDGVRLLGHLEGVDGHAVALAGDVAEKLAAADAYADWFFSTIDAFIAADGLSFPPPDPSNTDDGGPRGAAPETPRSLSLKDEKIGTVIWATGFTFDFGWVDGVTCDPFGYPSQRRGATDVPGLYFLGLNWMYRRKSGIIYGSGDDAAYVAAHIGAHLDGRDLPDPETLGDVVTGTIPVFWRSPGQSRP